MKIAPVSLNLSTITNVAFGKRTEAFKTSELTSDSFTKREDGYTKKYKALVKGAVEAQRKHEIPKPTIERKDIQFLLDIKDYEKFKKIITTPVEIKTSYGNYDTNIFFYTDADATRKLIKKLDNKSELKYLLLARKGYSESTVFHDIAKSDDVGKAKVLQESLSAKEFRKFLQAKNGYYETPYSIACDENNRLKAFIEPLLAVEDIK